MANLLQESTERLHTQGGRMTAQRRLILESLEGMGSHPTAEDLYGFAKQRDPSLHLSTVYRTLRWLEAEGLVSARLFGEDRQERFDLAHPIEHYHFQCTSCKTLIEFDTLLVNAIKAQFELHSGAQVELGSVVLYGLCAKCRRLQAETGLEKSYSLA